MEKRFICRDFKTREEDNKKYIRGYFAVFNSIYEICEGITESISPTAFSEMLDGDIRALINHDTTLVLGRTKANTLKLNIDDIGLFGEIEINQEDSDAMNLYTRVKRGDVDQCSFGFDILEETRESNEENVHYILQKLKLYEVSVTTFPAYEETSVSARKKDLKESKKRTFENWKEKTLKKVRGEI